MKKYRISNLWNISHSVFTSWLVSYCLLLLVPIIVSSIIYLEGKNILEKETYNVNGALLKQVQISMDNAFNDANSLVYKTGLNSKLLLFINKSLDRQNLDRALLQEVIKYLEEYNRDNVYAEDVYVYLPALDMVLSTSGLRDATAYYDFFYRNNPMYEGFTFDKWHTQMKGVNGGEYLTFSRNIEGADTGQTVLYMQSIPFNDSRRSSAMIVVKLSDRKIKEIMSGINAFANSAGMILGADNRMIIHTGSSAWNIANIDYARLDGDTGSLQANDMNGQRLAVTYIKSKYYDMKYVVAVPYSIFWSKVEYIKTLALASMAVCILLGGVLAYIFARRNYNPVNALLRLLERRTLLLRAGRSNEYQVIEAAMNSTLNENETINRELKQHNAVLRAVFLGKLLKGRITDREVLEKGLAAYEIEFDGENFAVMLFYLKGNAGPIGDNAKPGAEPEKATAVYQVIGNIFKEMASRNITGYFCETDDMLSCIVNIKNDDREAEKQNLYKMAFGIEEMIRSNNRDIQLFVAISSIHETVYGIPEAYQEALNVMDYKTTTENSAIIAYEEIKNSAGDYDYSMETEQKLINSIKAGNLEVAQSILDSVFDRNLTKPMLSYDLMKCIMFDIAGTMLKTLPEISSMRNSSFLKDMDITSRLLECETIKEMKGQMALILWQICQYIHQNKKTKKNELIEGIIEYVKYNYGSPDLNVSYLADKFSLTPAYLTHLFKEFTAESLFDHISRIRMENAKELLRDQEMNIKDVAQKVGYLNSAIFIRAFKKYEGITPGIYKEMG